MVRVKEDDMAERVRGGLSLFTAKERFKQRKTTTTTKYHQASLYHFEPQTSQTPFLGSPQSTLSSMYVKFVTSEEKLCKARESLGTHATSK